MTTVSRASLKTTILAALFALAALTLALATLAGCDKGDKSAAPGGDKTVAAPAPATRRLAAGSCKGATGPPHPSQTQGGARDGAASGPRPAAGCQPSARSMIDGLTVGNSSTRLAIASAPVRLLDTTTPSA